MLQRTQERLSNYLDRSRTVVRYTRGRVHWDGRNKVELTDGSARVQEIPYDPIHGRVSITFSTSGSISFNEPTANYACIDLNGITALECLTETKPPIFLGRDFASDEHRIDPTAIVTNEYPLRRVRRVFKSLRRWRPSSEAVNVALDKLTSYKSQHDI